MIIGNKRTITDSKTEREDVPKKEYLKIDAALTAQCYTVRVMATNGNKPGVPRKMLSE